MALGAPGAHAHSSAGTPTTQFSISEVKLLSTGPFKPGDLLKFELVTNLSKSEFHFIQISGECLTYPAEWHEGTEASFLDNSSAKANQAVAVVSSGCSNGLHRIQEVTLVSKDNTFARLTDLTATLPEYVVTRGHFVEGPASEKRSDSINLTSIPKVVKLAPNNLIRIGYLPRLTTNGQTISWTALGACKFIREFGMSDLGGRVIGTKIGKCSLSANTPWGSHLFNPVNIAFEVAVFSKNAVLCQQSKGKIITYTESSKCPKGFVKR